MTELLPSCSACCIMLSLQMYEALKLLQFKVACTWPDLEAAGRQQAELVGRHAWWWWCGCLVNLATQASVVAHSQMDSILLALAAGGPVACCVGHVFVESYQLPSLDCCGCAAVFAAWRSGRWACMCFRFIGWYLVSVLVFDWCVVVHVCRWVDGMVGMLVGWVVCSYVALSRAGQWSALQSRTP